LPLVPDSEEPCRRPAVAARLAARTEKKARGRPCDPRLRAESKYGGLVNIPSMRHADGTALIQVKYHYVLIP
jgi:hypothetical protein